MFFRKTIQHLKVYHTVPKHTCCNGIMYQYHVSVNGIVIVMYSIVTITYEGIKYELPV